MEGGNGDGFAASMDLIDGLRGVNYAGAQAPSLGDGVDFISGSIIFFCVFILI